MKYLKFLDGLRCLSVMWVLLIHLPLAAPGPLGFLASRGWMGVDMFFVISGYLITSILIHEQNKTNTINLRNFYLRRACRIWPAYYTVLACYLALGLLARNGFNPFEVDENKILTTLVWPATYLSNIYVSHTGSEDIAMLASWSLSLEEQFYLIWPLILLGGRQFALRTGIFVIAACTVWRIWLVFHYQEGVPAMTRIFYGPDTRMDVILYGAVLALVLQNNTARLQLERIYRSRLFLPLIAVFFLLVMYKTNRWSGWFGNSLGYGFIAASMATLLGYLVLIKPGKAIALLEWAPIVYVGKISYGIYLYHGGVIDGLLHVLGQPNTPSEKLLFSILAYATTIGLAGLSYRFLEAPIIKLKNRFGQTPVPASKTTTT